jgi:hypothetical protein
MGLSTGGCELRAAASASIRVWTVLAKRFVRLVREEGRRAYDGQVLSGRRRAAARRTPGFTALSYIDLHALGVRAAPLAVLHDFRVQELPDPILPFSKAPKVTHVAISRTDITPGPGSEGLVRPAAVAVANATGVRLTRAPLTPEGARAALAGTGIC